MARLGNSDTRPPWLNKLHPALNSSSEGIPGRDTLPAACDSESVGGDPSPGGAGGGDPKPGSKKGAGSLETGHNFSYPNVFVSTSGRKFITRSLTELPGGIPTILSYKPNAAAAGGKTLEPPIKPALEAAAAGPSHIGADPLLLAWCCKYCLASERIRTAGWVR